MAKIYRRVIREVDFDEQCARIHPDMRVLDDRLLAAEMMIARGLAKQLSIPKIPDTDVYVFRIDAGGSLPALRVFFSDDGETATFLAIEVVPEESEG